MNGEIGLDEYLSYYELNQKFFIPAHYDHALMSKNRHIAAEIIVPWLYVMGACIFILFAFITSLLLDCLK